MAVPEASVDEDDRFPRTKNNIRMSRKGFVMETISKARRVQSAADAKLGFRILPLYQGHLGASFRRDVLFGFNPCHRPLDLDPGNSRVV